MYDITDNMAFGECARCETKNIRETATHCPTCGFGLGATNSYSQPTDPRLVPEDPAALSYLVFDCRYYGALPFRMQGDCPVVVTALLQAAHSNDATAEGSLVDINGPMAEWLSAFGLTPAVGDVVLAVDGHLVTQLNSSQFKRLIKRKRQANKSQAAEEAPFITVTFRRHYLEVSQHRHHRHHPVVPMFPWRLTACHSSAESAPRGQEVRNRQAGGRRQCQRAADGAHS